MHKKKKFSYICNEMKTILKLILVLLLMMVGNRIIANATSEDNNGRDEELSLQHHQNDIIEKSEHVFILLAGESAPVLAFEDIPCRVMPSSEPTSSSFSFRTYRKTTNPFNTFITSCRSRQYDTNAPFYCPLPNGYYVFTLRHIIV